MRIKIVKCSDKENLWYSKFVGQTLTATLQNNVCRGTYICKDVYNNYTITGFIEPGDYQEVSK